MTNPDALQQLAERLGRSGRASSDYDLNPGVVLPEGRKLRPAAVMVPVVGQGADARVILTKRSSALQHHPGQIAFPGGKKDDADTDLQATALREAHEEIGLDPADVKVLAPLPGHETVTGFHVTPILAHIAARFRPVAEPGEVEEVFDVPLRHLLDTSRYSVERRLWRGTWRRYYIVPFGPYYIWGATARILHAMAEVAESG